MHDIRIKRVYEAPQEADGMRVLVDRVWPRGVSKDKAAVDLWMKEIGPSTALRQWFGHKPERWAEFRKRYMAELTDKNELVGQLRGFAAKGPLTLVYSARDEERNQAVVIREAVRDGGVSDGGSCYDVPEPEGVERISRRLKW